MAAARLCLGPGFPCAGDWHAMGVSPTAPLTPADLRRDTRHADFAFAATVVVGIVLVGLLYLAFSQIVTVLLVAALLSYALLPAVDRLHRHMPRWAAVATVGLAGAGLIVLIGFLTIPAAFAELAHLSDVSGRLQLAAADAWRDFLAWLPAPLAASANRIGASLSRSFSMNAPSLETMGAWLARAGSGVAAIASGLLFVPVFVVVMLRGHHRILHSASTSVIPPRWRPRFRERGRQLDDVLAGFVRGQLLVSLILAIAYAIVFAIIGIPLALVVGLIAGFAELVPYLGGAIALILGSLMALAGGETRDILWIVIAFVTIQAIQGTLISPYVVGRRAKLGLGTVIVALAIGGELFGLLGLLFSVPVAAMLKVAGRAAVEGYRHTDFYVRESDLAPAPPPAADLAPGTGEG